MKPIVLTALVFCGLAGCIPADPNREAGFDRSGPRVSATAPRLDMPRWFPDKPGVYTRSLPFGRVETVVVDAHRGRM